METEFEFQRYILKNNVMNENQYSKLIKVYIDQ